MAEKRSRSPHFTRFALRADSGLFLGNVFPLASKRTVIGRSVEAEIPVDDTRVSRSHASIDFQAGHPMVVDLGSTNGTFVNGFKVDHVKRVTVGDKIRIGSAVFVVELFDDAKEKLKKSWKAQTQTMLRKNIQIPPPPRGETQALKQAKDATGLRWTSLLDATLWKQNRKTLEPWVLGLLCLGLMLIALAL